MSECEKVFLFHHCVYERSITSVLIYLQRENIFVKDKRFGLTFADKDKNCNRPHFHAVALLMNTKFSFLLFCGINSGWGILRNILAL